MTENLLRILLSELKTVRVRCVNCKTIVEVDIAELLVKFREGRCEFCKEEFHLPANATNPFIALAVAVENFARMEDRVTVEFSLPLPDRPPSV